MDFFKITKLLQFGDTDYFDIPVIKQNGFISSLKEPKDDYDRSYNQYRCQCFFMPYWKPLILNIISALLFSPTILVLIVRGFFDKKGKRFIDCYGDFWGIEEIIPDILRNTYAIEVRKWENIQAIEISDLRFLGNLILRYPLSASFVLKCTLKMAMYSHIIRMYHPRAIIVHNEPSYTNSFLTLYCNSHQVKHINVMHGEKLYNIRDSFFRFDECYVWSDYYVKLFNSLRVDIEQMRIAVPPSLRIEHNKYNNINAFSNFKYYLAIYSEDELLSIVNSLKFAKEKGLTIKYRPHPRYSDINLLKKYVKDDEIEWPKDISILESLSNVECAIGSYTTVLTQAYFSGVKVILDDVTYSQRYNKLKELKYFLSNIDLPVLSQFQ